MGVTSEGKIRTRGVDRKASTAPSTAFTAPRPLVRAPVFVFTLDKTGGQFSPSTRYKDYAISPSLIHWESQTGTSASSPTGQRYQHHEKLGSRVFLFGRRSAEDRAFHFLGRPRYVSHKLELPMAVTWQLEVPLPGDLLRVFAAAVA